MQDYDELNNILMTAGAGVHASECHGFLCALVCGNGQIDEQKVRDFFLLDSEEIESPEECLDAVNALAVETQAQIQSEDLDLELLLANDEDSLEERSRSLAEWCQGFMSGIGLSGVKQEQLPPESKELIDDFYKIAQLDPESEGTSQEENDFALMELSEYVRMGALFIFEELQSPATDENAEKPEVLH